MKLEKIVLMLLVLSFQFSIVKAQIPVEVFGGDKKATVDIMFFKFFKNKEGHNSKFLFFNRNRASIDYEMTTTTSLPQFGFTEAFSYNHEKLKGFAPVAVVQVLTRGVLPKAGIQFAKIKHNFVVFTWLVCETLAEPDLDYFLLLRYTPKLTDKLNLFTQAESVNAFPTVMQNQFSFTQRFRLGLQIKEFQFGAGLDMSQLGRNDFTKTENFGGFLRYEF